MLDALSVVCMVGDMEKRLVKSFIHVERGDDDVTVDLSAVVTKEDNKIDFNKVESTIELDAAEYRNAEDAIADAARHYWITFEELT